MFFLIPLINSCGVGVCEHNAGLVSEYPITKNRIDETALVKGEFLQLHVQKKGHSPQVPIGTGQNVEHVHMTVHYFDEPPFKEHNENTGETK